MLYSSKEWQNFYCHKQPPGVFYKKAVLKNFTIFTGKHQCWGLFFKTFLNRDSKTGVSGSLAKYSRLPNLKNICELLLLGYFNGLLLHKRKGSTSILHDSVRLQWPSHRYSLLFLSRYLWSWNISQACLRKRKIKPYDESMKFLDWLVLVDSDGFRLFLTVLGCFRLFFDCFRSL